MLERYSIFVLTKNGIGRGVEKSSMFKSSLQNFCTCRDFLRSDAWPPNGTRFHLIRSDLFLLIMACSNGFGRQLLKTHLSAWPDMNGQISYYFLHIERLRNSEVAVMLHASRVRWRESRRIPLGNRVRGHRECVQPGTSHRDPSSVIYMYVRNRRARREFARYKCMHVKKVANVEIPTVSVNRYANTTFGLTLLCCRCLVVYTELWLAAVSIISSNAVSKPP